MQINECFQDVITVFICMVITNPPQFVCLFVFFFLNYIQHIQWQINTESMKKLVEILKSNCPRKLKFYSKQ